MRLQQAMLIFQFFSTHEEDIFDLSTSDVNSLMMINRFLSSIASGIRRPSDKDKASEMRHYMSSFLERNNITP